MPVSKYGKSYYTQEQFEAARYHSSALEYAQSRGYNLEKKGNGYYTLKEHDSMVFTENGQWFWNSRQMRGGAIEFIVAYENKSFVDAVLTLADERVHEQLSSVETPKPEHEEPKDFTLPERSKEAKRVFAYLINERSIDKAIISELVHEKKIYQSEEHGNAVFVGYDENGNAKNAFQRGTSSYAENPLNVTLQARINLTHST